MPKQLKLTALQQKAIDILRGYNKSSYQFSDASGLKLPGYAHIRVSTMQQLARKGALKVVKTKSYPSTPGNYNPFTQQWGFKEGSTIYTVGLNDEHR